jgi:polyisoprenoid-binding protein YceI
MYRPLKLVFLLVLVVAGVSSARAEPWTWTLDKDHTEVRFTWDHLGMSRQGGRFLDVQGTVVFDPENPAGASVEVSLPLGGLSTGVAKLDEHLVKTKDFFDAEAHPAITFKSTGVSVKSDRTFDVTGDLTINGVSRPVTLDVVWNFTGDHPLASINPAYAAHYSSGFSATTQILRSDWGIKRTIPFVSDEIRISIETEMHLAGPKPAVAEGPAGEAGGQAGGEDSGSAAAKGGDGGAGDQPDGSAAPDGLGDEKVDQVP